VAKKKIIKKRLDDLGISLSPLTTDDELDVESAKIAAREREFLIIAAIEREIYGRANLLCMPCLIVHLMNVDAT